MPRKYGKQFAPKKKNNKENSLRILPSQFDMLNWCKSNLTTEKGEGLDFELRPYLKEIYDCLSSTIVIKKSAQMGLSNFAIDKALWFATNFNKNIIYTMPTSNDVSDFSQSRVNPIILNSKINVPKIVDNVKIKQIGNSFIYFRGTWEEKQAISVPSDFNIHDEIDRSKLDVIEMFAERQSASLLKWKLFLSTPTFSNYGIDAHWNETDKREWFVKCDNCGLAQILTENHIDKASNSFRCEKCHQPLKNGQGCWIKTGKGTIAGYHVTQLMAGWITPAEILNKKNDYKFKRDYYNFVLGECFDGGDEALNRLDIINCICDFDKLPKQTINYSAGIDWGDTSWVVVKQGTNIIHFAKIEGDTRTHVSQILNIVAKFPHCKVVADFGYGDMKNQELKEKLPNRFWACIYTDGGKDTVPRFDNEKQIVNVDRSRSIEERILEFKEGKTKIARSELIEQFISHHLNVVAKRKEDAHGNIRVLYDRIGADHFVHANNYASLPDSQTVAKIDTTQDWSVKTDNTNFPDNDYTMSNFPI